MVHHSFIFKLISMLRMLTSRRYSSYIDRYFPDLNDNLPCFAGIKLPWFDGLVHPCSYSNHRLVLFSSINFEIQFKPLYHRFICRCCYCAFHNRKRKRLRIRLWTTAILSILTCSLKRPVYTSEIITFKMIEYMHK